MPEANRKRAAVEIHVANIQPDPRQARKAFDQEKLAALAASIQQEGLINPILVRPNPRGEGHLLIAGERRWRACGSLGWPTITAVVFDVDDQTANVLALIDNIDREDLTPIEEAQALAELVRRDFSGNRTKAAQRLGKPVKYVDDRLTLLDLPNQVQDFVATGKLAIAAALILAKLPRDNPERIIKAAETAVRRNLSVAALQAYLQPGDDDEHGIPNANGKRVPKPEVVSAAIQTLYDKVDAGWEAWPRGVREALADQFTSLVLFLTAKIKEVKSGASRPSW